jgi:hypothetical protein
MKLKKTGAILFLFLVSINVAFWIPFYFDGFIKNSAEITPDRIRDAVVIGLLIPTIILFSGKYKNSNLLLLIAAIALAVFFGLSELVLRAFF